MPHKIRAFGLALVALAVMGAIAASAAQAVVQFNATKFPVEIHAEGGGKETFTTSGGTVTCTFSTFSGEATKASTELTVHPVYSGCTAFGFIKAEAETKGCNYVFTATEKTSADNYNAHTKIECEAGKKIKVGVTGCKATIEEITANNALTTVDLIDKTAGKPVENTVDVRPTVKNIHYVVTEVGTFGCKFKKVGETFTDGEYTSSANIPAKGRNPANHAEQIGIVVEG